MGLTRGFTAAVSQAAASLEFPAVVPRKSYPGPARFLNVYLAPCWAILLYQDGFKAPLLPKNILHLF